MFATMSRVCCCYAALLLLGLSVASAYDITNKGWWKNTAFYQIYPRSFMDSNGDGIGDLNGITSKLDYFVEAGIGAVWLSPIYASPMADFGYDISNFMEIQPEYGSMTDFEALTKRAKELKLKVILDLVPNHSSDENEWFEKSVNKDPLYEDFYIWRKGKNATTPPNNWISVFGGPAWTYSTARGEWYFHQFLAKQPDLNYFNPRVRSAMEEVIFFWLSKGVDGFRIDAIPHLFEDEDLRDEPRSNITGAEENEYTYLEHIYTKDHPKTYDVLRSWRTVVDDYAAMKGSDEVVLMTEAYTSLEKTVEFYDAGAHVPFNFKFITDVDVTSPPSAFKIVIDSWMKEANARNGTANWVMGNHDRSRTETRYPNRGDQMMMLAMMLPGVSVTYYGEEIGMVDKTDISWEDTQDPQGCQAGVEKYKEKSRDPCRTPFQWNGDLNAGFSTNPSGTWIPINDNWKTLNLEAQKMSLASHFSLFRNLTTLKKTSSAVANGTLTTLVKAEDRVLVILRTHKINSVANETVILIMNFNQDDTVVVDIGNDIDVKIALNGSIFAANEKATSRPGQWVNLNKVSLGATASYVILANQPRPYVNGSGINEISFFNIITMLFVGLLMAFR